MKSSLIVVMAAFFLTSCGPVNPPIATEPLTPTAVAQVEDFSSKDLPNFSWDSSSNYKVDQFIEAAMKLQTLGKDKAVELLRHAISNRTVPDDTLFILCRMLFTAKPDGKFRRPALGAASVMGGSDNFSLEPAAIVEGVPFLVVNRYTLADVPEPIDTYLNYCLSECEWNTLKYSPKTAAQKTMALEKLLWKHPLSPNEMGFVTAQIE